MGTELPPPPNYAAAQREGIEAYVENLPAIYQAEIEWGPLLSKAKAEGGVEAADIFAHGLLQMQQKYGVEFVKQRLEELETQDPQWLNIRNTLGDETLNNLMDSDQARLDKRRELDPVGEAIRDELGTQTQDFISQDPDALDPERQKAADELLNKARGDLSAGESGARQLSDLTMGRAGKGLGETKEEKALQDRLTASGLSAIDRKLSDVDPELKRAYDRVLEGALKQYKLRGKLDPETYSQVTQAERRAQAARGNLYGTAPAAAEAISTGLHAEARRDRQYQQYIQALAGRTGYTGMDVNYRIQGQNYAQGVDAANLRRGATNESIISGQISDAGRAQQQEAYLRGQNIGNLSGVLSSGLSSDAIRRANRGVNLSVGSSYLSSGLSSADTAYRQRQQDYSNAGAYLGGQTPSNMFAGMSQGSTGATPTDTSLYRGGEVFQGAAQSGASGVNWAANNYNQAVNFAASQGNPWVQGLGMVAGLGTGMAVGGTGFFAKK